MRIRVISAANGANAAIVVIFMLIKTLDVYLQIEDAWIKMYQMRLL